MSNEQLSSVYRYTDPTLQNNLRFAVSLLRLDVIWSLLKIQQQQTHIENPPNLSLQQTSSHPYKNDNRNDF